MIGVMLAGGIPQPGDSLYELSQGKPKALIELAGQPMAAWVGKAIAGCRHIRHLIIVGLAADQLDLPITTSYIPNQPSLIDNAIAGIQAAIDHTPQPKHILLATADIPLITPQLIDHFIKMCHPLDKLLYYPYVPRPEIEKAFPAAKRTYARLKDAEGAGGDLFIVDPKIIEGNVALWESLTNARKKPWQVASVVGLPTLLRLLTRRLTIAGIEQKAHELLGAPIQLIQFPDPRIAMDGDKAHQITLLRNALDEKIEQTR